MAATLITMKLLVDSRPPCPRVVFAEAHKDAVDFLFSLLAMPTSNVLKHLGNESMVGCIGNLYTSIEKLDDPYVQPGAAKDAILTPTVLPRAAKSNRSFFRLPELSPAMKRFFGWGGYTYSSSRNYVTEERGAQCPMCGTQMFGDSQYVSSEHLTQEAKGLVQGGMVTYTVTDDLKIFPMSNISSIALLNTIAVRDLGALQERIVQLGYKEGVEILKTSLQSKTVLTDVFLGKKT
ncbi:uncharacterized protein LOC124649659 [Lolium rigidum]|uniref:uncharacterized protein LOC124649659 n=1 Tax=Lolium rigidum TaxID=89674 RepID=UPI001F5C13CD|nr:uncharacterized protein LOC124649659 [Lolium rigidum]